MARVANMSQDKKLPNYQILKRVSIWSFAKSQTIHAQALELLQISMVGSGTEEDILFDLEFISQRLQQVKSGLKTTTFLTKLNQRLLSKSNENILSISASFLYLGLNRTEQKQYGNLTRTELSVEIQQEQKQYGNLTRNRSSVGI